MLYWRRRVREAAASVLASSRNRIITRRELRRASDPDGRTGSEFITFGTTQRTLNQIGEVGGKLIEARR
ncbi:MAG: hypothetical protein ABSD75_19835 [Terriglobales bacterium]|jgi:hypothetical protein